MKSQGQGRRGTRRGASGCSSKSITCPGRCVPLPSSQFENNYFTQMCSGSEAGSYLRRIDFVYHSTLGLGVMKKKKEGMWHIKDSRRQILALAVR